MLSIANKQTSAFGSAEKSYANTANNLRVTHFECQLMTSNRVFSLRRVAYCDIQSENIEVTSYYFERYQRHGSTKENATRCRIKHQSMRWF